MTLELANYQLRECARYIYQTSVMHEKTVEELNTVQPLYEQEKKGMIRLADLVRMYGGLPETEGRGRGPT